MQSVVHSKFTSAGGEEGTKAAGRGEYIAGFLFVAKANVSENTSIFTGSFSSSIPLIKPLIYAPAITQVSRGTISSGLMFWHLIYRGEENTLPNKMVLIDSVDVTGNGFTYVDKGRYKNIPIAEDRFYTYRVLTRGTYGNPKIKRQENFSQMVHQYPENKLLPCQPIAVASLVNCEDYINANTCDQTEFSNTLTWGSSTDIIRFNNQQPNIKFLQIRQS